MVLLGFIRKQDRTQPQADAHAAAEAQMHKALALPPVDLNSGEKLCLFDAWKDPLVVADCGLTFDRFHQLTGSCVGAGGGNATFTLIAVQRLLAVNPTKAFIPFWPFDYGRCRYEEGDRGQGEGAMGSAFAQALTGDGVLDASTSGLPVFSHSDGLMLTSSLEYQWSDGGSNTVTQWQSAAKVHPVGSAAVCNNIQDVKTALLNGYPITFACDNYIGNASVQGSGADAAVCGYWDDRGGHQQSLHAYWNNPTLGPLYWAQNNWAGDTYPRDPAGGPICGCWVTEAHVQSAMNNLDAEVYALSHLNWFPAQPSVMSWVI